MNEIAVSSDIIPVGQFKSNLAKYMKEIQMNRNPLIITQNGKPAGVLISPSEFDEMLTRKRFLNSISRGLSDVEKGDVFSTAQVKKILKNRRAEK